MSARRAGARASAHGARGKMAKGCTRHKWLGLHLAGKDLRHCRYGAESDKRLPGARISGWGWTSSITTARPRRLICQRGSRQPERVDGRVRKSWCWPFPDGAADAHTDQRPTRFRQCQPTPICQYGPGLCGGGKTRWFRGLENRTDRRRRAGCLMSMTNGPYALRAIGIMSCLRIWARGLGCRERWADGSENHAI